MSYKEPAFMRDLHRIREEYYKETKGLSSKEKAERTNRGAEEVLKEYGFRFVQGEKGDKIVKA